METESIRQIRKLYRITYGENPTAVDPLYGSGSNREYYRIKGGNDPIIGVYNPEPGENSAFLSFTRTFRHLRLPVPEIYAGNKEETCYLIEDLGDTTLFSFLQKIREKGVNQGSSEGSYRHAFTDFPEEAVALYKQVLYWLPQFQVTSAPHIEYAKCYPRPAFDHQSMMWDLSYFKYYYLKMTGIRFDEQLLENDFRSLTGYLLEAPTGYFMYRDFQSRNIMIRNGDPWFIDYQGGRAGPLQYDLVSLLYDARADIPERYRESFTQHYLKALSEVTLVDRELFFRYLPGFALIRILQAFGAYGYRGYYQKKIHFLQSVPYALKNISGLASQPFVNKFPELRRVIGLMTEQGQPPATSSQAKQRPSVPAQRLQSAVKNTGQPPVSACLNILICSFSYREGIPTDPSGNGGGFVFDCRSLPNPGRLEAYRTFTGRDEPVIRYLESEPEVAVFLEHTFNLVDVSVMNYLKREFDHLMISYGCTGGQHRSVYCAERLAEHLAGKYGPDRLHLKVIHHMLNENKV